MSRSLTSARVSSSERTREFTPSSFVSTRSSHRAGSRWVSPGAGFTTGCELPRSTSSAATRACSSANVSMVSRCPALGSAVECLDEQVFDLGEGLFQRADPRARVIQLRFQPVLLVRYVVEPHGVSTLVFDQGVHGCQHGPVVGARGGRRTRRGGGSRRA